MKKKGTLAAKHVRLYSWEMASPAWRSLSTDARALLLELRLLYAGRENRVFLSLRDMQTRLNVGQRRAQKARDELIDRGFIRTLQTGSFERKMRHASEFALLNEPIDQREGSTPPMDYMKWGKKNTVVVTATDGSRGDYRGNPEKSRKGPDGSRDSYRDPPKRNLNGSRHDCTFSLPPPTEKKARPGWEIKGAQWRCRNGLVLDRKCAVCAVWITHARQEFDGARHKCDPVSKRAAATTQGRR